MYRRWVAILARARRWSGLAGRARLRVRRLCFSALRLQVARQLLWSMRIGKAFVDVWTDGCERQCRIEKSAKGEDKPQEGAIIQPEGALKRWNALTSQMIIFLQEAPYFLMTGVLWGKIVSVSWTRAPSTKNDAVLYWKCIQRIRVPPVQCPPPPA